MAVKNDIQYSCGCGFKTNDLSKAVDHSETTGHQLTVLGTIKKVK